jgi:hypothetical protein
MKIRGDEPFFRLYENCRRPGVAILDMQMSKVPIISGYAVGCPIFLLSILISKYLLKK